MPMVYQNNKIIAMSLASSSETSSQEIYSTEEQVIGRWIDGKPLYRKIFTEPVDMPTSTSVAVFDKRDYDMDTVTTLYGMVNRYTENIVQPFGRDSSVYDNQNLSSITVRNVIDSPMRLKFLVVEYTKTTDTASASSVKEPTVTVPEAVSAKASSAKYEI